MPFIAGLVRSNVGAGGILFFALLHPEQASKPGFLLSALATAAIITTHSLRESSLWKSAWTISLRTSLATAPLVLWHFGGVPIIGIVANVLLLPIATLALVPLAFIHALGAAIGVDAWTAPLFTKALDGLIGSAKVLSTVDWGMNLPPPSLNQGLILAICVALCLTLRKVHQRIFVICVAALAIGSAEYVLRNREKPKNRIRMTALDVSQRRRSHYRPSRRKCNARRRRRWTSQPR